MKSPGTRSSFACIALIAAAATTMLPRSADASIAYFNLPTFDPDSAGFASDGETADDLVLDLSGGTTLQSATVRFFGMDAATGTSLVQLRIYANDPSGGGRPGALLTGGSYTIHPGGPAFVDHVFDVPDVVLASPIIWASIQYDHVPSVPAFVGCCTVPTIGSTTSRGATSLGGGLWNVQGASGPPPGGGLYFGDELQISIKTTPTPATCLVFAGVGAAAMRRRRQLGG